MAEIIVNHDSIRDPQSITDVMEREFKARDMDIHRHEVTHLEDDHKKGVRKITIKNTKYFMMPQVPWKR
jgi:hypothetical protein